MKLPGNLPHYSPKILLRASLLLLLCVPDMAMAAAGPYDVENVVVDAAGKDTTDARGKALAKGQKDAFSQLIIRLDPAHAAQIFAQVTPQQVTGTVRSFKVVEEKMSADHYHATLNYSFLPAPILAMGTLPPAAASTAAPATQTTPAPAGTMMQAVTAAAPTPVTPAPPPVESLSKAVLVLPVYNQGNNALELWQDDNKWRNVWYDAALESGAGRVVVPIGDLNDRVDVDDTNVTTATTDSVKRMYKRYGVGDVVVMTSYFDEKADPKPTLQVSYRKLSDPKAPPVQLSYIIHADETLDSLLARASNDLARRLYKQQTIDPGKIEYDRLKEIGARMNTTSIQEWQALRSKLLMRSNIMDVKFISISYYETTMSIIFKGTPDMLGKTLVASGLRVMQDGDKLVLSLK